MRYLSIPALLLSFGLFVGCSQDATVPIAPEDASFARGGGGGTLKWYAEFNDIDLGKSLDIKIYHYSYHESDEASGSGTFQVLASWTDDLESNLKGRLNVNNASNDYPDGITASGTSNQGHFDLSISQDAVRCGDLYRADLRIEGYIYPDDDNETTTGPEHGTFCGNLTYENYQ